MRRVKQRRIKEELFADARRRHKKRPTKSDVRRARRGTSSSKAGQGHGNRTYVAVKQTNFKPNFEQRREHRQAGQRLLDRLLRITSGK